MLVYSRLTQALTTRPSLFKLLNQRKLHREPKHFNRSCRNIVIGFGIICTQATLLNIPLKVVVNFYEKKKKKQYWWISYTICVVQPFATEKNCLNLL